MKKAINIWYTSWQQKNSCTKSFGTEREKNWSVLILTFVDRSLQISKHDNIHSKIKLNAYPRFLISKYGLHRSKSYFIRNEL